MAIAQEEEHLWASHKVDLIPVFPGPHVEGSFGNTLNTMFSLIQPSVCYCVYDREKSLCVCERKLLLLKHWS